MSFFMGSAEPRGCTGRQTGQGSRRCCGGHIEHNQYLAVPSLRVKETFEEDIKKIATY